MAPQESDLAKELQELTVRIEKMERNVRLDLLRIATGFLGTAIAILLALGYLYISVTTKDIFYSENQKVIDRLNAQHLEEVGKLRNENAWRAFHDGGVRYRHALKDYSEEDVIRRAISSFEEALRHQQRAETFWELAQLRYFIPRNLKLDRLVNVERALQDLQTASLNYTEEQREAGWLADAYFDMAEMNSHQHSETKDPTRKQELRDRERQNLERAREAYARVDISDKPWIAKKLTTINDRLAVLGPL